MSQHSSNCPICDGTVTLGTNLEVSEVVTCKECNNRLVVKSINAECITLGEAPQIEEDWGQ